jgi:hypothetical protein
MADFLDLYADALRERAGDKVSLSRQIRNPLLDLARVVAHGTERKNAPLAAFLAGRYVEMRRAQGADDAAAVAEAVEIAEKLAPPAEG